MCIIIIEPALIYVSLTNKEHEGKCATAMCPVTSLLRKRVKTERLIVLSVAG